MGLEGGVGWQRWKRTDRHAGRIDIASRRRTECRLPYGPPSSRPGRRCAERHPGTDTHHGYSRRQTRHTPGYWYSSWLQQTSDTSYTGVLILIIATADVRYVIHRGTDTHHGYSRHQIRHTPGYWYSSWLQQTSDKSYTGVLILIMVTADVRHVIHRGTDTHHGYSRRQTRHTPEYWYSS